MSEGIIGIILAGGKSSRMGKDKASLVFSGKTMVSRMADVLQKAGAKEILISGPSSFETGLDYIPDGENDRGKGPARAIINCLGYFPADAQILFVPVDMPLLDEVYLRKLLEIKAGACFRGYPLPIHIKKSDGLPASIQSSVQSVRDIISFYAIKEIPLPEGAVERQMMNTNTPEEWEKGLAYECQV